MDRCTRTHWSLISYVTFAFVLLFTQSAWAGANDAIARKLRDEAINQDYLATNFADADKKLVQAAELCGQADSCTQETRARILCDRGVVALAMQKQDQARALFIQAIQASPGVGIDKDLSSAEAQKEFAAAKKLAAAAPLASGSAPVTGAPAGGDDSDNAGLIHTPPQSQAVQTPVPIYVELMEGVSATKVLLRFKPAGSSQWKSATMLKVGNGFGVEVSCEDVGVDEGKIEYYVQALDTNGDLVGSSGRQAKPHVVPLVTKLQGRAPRYPNRPPPKRCSAGGEAAPLTPLKLSDSDCPPGIAGCKGVDKPMSCTTTDECSGSETCVSGTCQLPEAEQPIKANLLSLSFQQDFLLLPSAKNACNGGENYACWNRSNSKYFSDPAIVGVDDSVNGGAALATSRLMAGYDRVIGGNLAVGGRLGVALNEGPARPKGAASLPVHLEARAAYWFGQRVFAKKGLRFFVNGALGAAEVDAVFAVQARDAAPSNYGQLNNLNAWTKTGMAFGAVGAGGMWAFGATHGVTLEAKVMELFPTAGTAFGVQLGYLYGL